MTHPATAETVEQRAERLVRQEVHYCVSSLVSTLAAGHGCTFRGDAEKRDAVNLGLLTTQAMELCSPLLDYEEAAREAGWLIRGATQGGSLPDRYSHDDYGAFPVSDFSGWEEVCEMSGTHPHDREVFEHWIVSDWLADKLAEKGEKVDKDFAGMTVWARTTTGQGIASDSVVESIAKELLAS